MTVPDAFRPIIRPSDPRDNEKRKELAVRCAPKRNNERVPLRRLGIWGRLSENDQVSRHETKGVVNCIPTSDQ